MRSIKSLYLTWLLVLSSAGLAPAWAEAVDFQVQLLGTATGTTGGNLAYDANGEPYTTEIVTTYTGTLKLTLTHNDINDPLVEFNVAGYVGYAETGITPITRNLVPNAPPSTYTLRVQGGGFDGAGIDIIPPAGYTIQAQCITPSSGEAHVNNHPSGSGIWFEVTGSIDQTFTITLLPPSGGAQTGGGTINPPAPATPGYLLNLSATFQSASTATVSVWDATTFSYIQKEIPAGSLRATLNDATAGGNLYTQYFYPNIIANNVATLLQPGKTYNLTVSGNGFNNGEIVLSPPAGFSVWVDGVPTTLLRYYGGSNGTSVTKFYTVMLLPAGGTFSGPAGASSSLQSGSIGWEVALGSLRNGTSAGALMLSDHGRSTSWAPFFSPAALSYNDTSPEVRLHRENGILSQIASNEALVDIVNTPNDSAYELRFYPPVDPSASLPLTPTGTPYVTYRVARDGSDTRLRITRTTFSLNLPGAPVARTDWTTLQRTGTYPNFIWELSDWTLEGAAAPTRERRIWVGLANGDYIENQQLLNESGTVVRETRTTHAKFDWGFAPIKSLAGGISAGPSGIVSDTFYYTDPADPTRYSQPRYAFSSNGNAEAYDYTVPTGNLGLGMVKKTYTPFLDGYVSDPDPYGYGASWGYTYDDLYCVVSSFNYTADAFGDLRRLSGSEVRVNGVLTAQTSIAYSTASAWANGPRLLTATRTERASATDALVSTTTVFDVISSDPVPGTGTLSTLTDSFYRDQVHATTSPTGVRQSYIRHRGTWNATTQAFSIDGNGAASRIGVIQGLASEPAGLASKQITSVDVEGYAIEPVYVVSGKSTLSYTYRDAAARVVRTESYVWHSGDWQLVDWVSFTNNGPAGQLTQRTTSRGEVEDMEYTGLLLTQTTDATGTVTTYTHDAAGRIETTTREAFSPAGYPAQAAVTNKFTYDAADQVTGTETYSSPTGEKLISTRAYDLLGRVTSETPAGLGPTTTTYDTNAGTRTVTTPDGATSIYTTYADGQLASVTGTAKVAEYYTYGVEADGRRWSRVDVSTPDSLNWTRSYTYSESLRWSKSWTDWLGRTVQSEAPPFSGTVNRVSTQTYDTRGLLSRSTAPGSPLTLYEYDAFGTLSRTTADFSGNEAVDLASEDQITEQKTEIVSESGTYWLKTETTGYLTLNIATPTKLGETRTRLTGYSSANTLRDEAWSEDIEGNRTTAKVTVDRATRKVERISTAPGTATTPGAESKEESRNGRVVKTTAADGITLTTGYDALGRANTTTHVRSGTTRTTTVAYKFGTTLPETVIDPASITTSTTIYDDLARPVAVKDAFDHIVRSAYTPRGELAKQWGDATYPVSFEYNNYGERTTLRTYQSDAGNQWTAATWPDNPGGVVSTSTWNYDPASGGLLSQVDADNKSVEFSYYPDGRLHTRSWARKLNASTVPVKSTYQYLTNTSQIEKIEYNDDTHPITYGGFTRSGAPTTIIDATGTRTLAYDTAAATPAPWRFKSETLPDLFGGRVLTGVYQTETNAAAGTRGSPAVTLGTVKGALKGYQLGTAANPAADLEILYATTTTGRLAGLDSRVGTAAATAFDYAYTPDTRLVASLTTGAFAQTRTYDPVRDLPTGIASTWSGTTRLSTTAEYNDLRQPTRRTQGGSLTTTDYGDVLTTDYGYDARHQLTAATSYLGANAAPVASLPGRDFAYAYDAIGNRTSSTPRAAETTRSVNPAPKSTYGVNPLNQYTRRTHTGVAYSGLAAANAKVAVDGRLAQRQGSYFWEEATFTGAAAVRRVTLAAALAGTGGAADTAKLDDRYAFFPGSIEDDFAYDLDGNLTADGTWSYTKYDAENRLIRQEQKPWTILPGAPNAKRLDYTYDYQGRRVRKVVKQWLGTPAQGSWSPLSDTLYIYQGWNLIAETNASGSLLRSYTWGLDITGDLSASGGVGALVQIVDYSDTTLKRLLPSYDLNGNVVTLTNAATGATEAQYEYSPYGELLRASGGYAKSNPFRFSTKYTDDETGLVYYGYRFYDPRNGRFINRDPIDIQGGYNLYAFVNNSSINNWDYLGLQEKPVILSTITVTGYFRPRWRWGDPLTDGDYREYGDYGDSGDTSVPEDTEIFKHEPLTPVTVSTTGIDLDVTPNTPVTVSTTGIKPGVIPALRPWVPAPEQGKFRRLDKDYVTGLYGELINLRTLNGEFSERYIIDLYNYNSSKNFRNLSLDQKVVASGLFQNSVGGFALYDIGSNSRGNSIDKALANVRAIRTQAAENTAGKFSVGIYDDIRGTVPGLDAHHVGQKAVMGKLIPGYDPATAPSILVPKVGHTIRGPNGIVSRSTEGFTNPRDVIARDIMELRRVYPDVPNSKLQELIQMNKDLYPSVRK